MPSRLITGADRSRLLAAATTVALLIVALFAASAQAATITVTNTGDGVGKCPSATECTLRAAVEFAKAGDTISLGATTYTLSGSPIEIEKDITIAGAGAGSTILTSSPKNQLIDLYEAELSISGITLKGAVAPAREETVSKHAGVYPGEGGAIYNDYGVLRVNGCAFTEDKAQASFYVTTYGSAGYGGAIFNDGKTTISASTFTNDTAEGAAADTEYDRGGEGGAIFNDYGQLSISSSTFTGNNTTGAADATTKYNDGGIGGAVYSEDGRLTVAGSTFSGNVAHGGTTAQSGAEAGSDGYGGALYTEGETTISNSTFTGNTADSGADAVSKNGGGGDGGAIYNDDGSLTLTGSVVKENVAASTHNGGYGGGVYSYGSMTIEQSTITANKAPNGYGGALYDEDGRLNLIQSTVSGNEAASGAGLYSETSTGVSLSTISGNKATEDGGGIYNEEPELELTQSTVSSNTAEYGGGIYNDAPLGATNSTIANNSATEEGGGIYNDALASLANVTLFSNSITKKASGGGNLYLDDYELTLHDTLIAAGSAPTSGGNCAFESGIIVSKGYNAEDSNQCQLDGPGDQVNAALDLGPLASNGGPTQTVALLAGSAAIDKGDPAGCTNTEGELLTVDQRGVARPQNGRCDIGAFEYVPPVSPPPPPPPANKATAPKLSGLKVSPSSFKPSSGSASIASHHKGKKPKGTTVSYSDTEAASTTFTVVELEHGYRVGKGLCKAAPASGKKPKHGKACIHEVTLKGSFVHADAAGHNQFEFTGHVDGQKLAKGSYVLIATPRLSGLTGSRVSAAFKIG